MKFDVLDRWFGKVQFTAEIDCADDTPYSIKVGLAVRWAIKNSADLRSANLRSADLGGANLGGANLRSADLRSANLGGADLGGAKNADLAIARTRILAEGDIVGWKKCRDNVIVKLRIPADAKRSHAFGRKCRAEFADVLEVIGAERGVSIHDGKTEYLAGQRVTPDGFDEDWREECSTGVHFYISRVEAEAHS